MPVVVLPMLVLVCAVVVPVPRAVMVMVVVMAAGSGQRIAHASQHASDRALQHVNTYDPEAGTNEMQLQEAAIPGSRASLFRNTRLKARFG